MEKKETQEMWAEAMREAGTLALTFVPIYVVVENTQTNVNWWIFGAAMLAGIALLVTGILLERHR